VKLSADGVPFLLHDATLQRTTNGSGAAGERAWHELSRLDAGGWHGRPYAGEPIPSLDAVAAFVLRNGFLLNIEIKPSPGAERRTGEAVAAYVAQRWQGAAVPPLLSSFKPEALAGAQAAAPQLPRALLLDHLREGWFEQAQALQCVAVVFEYPLLDAALIRRLHDAGLRAMAYTVNDPAAALHLHAAGVDGLITDEVARFSPVDGVVRD
jgi:glycerophosphoryl diester phosphodiesterase